MVRIGKEDSDSASTDEEAFLRDIYNNKSSKEEISYLEQALAGEHHHKHHAHVHELEGTDPKSEDKEKPAASPPHQENEKIEKIETRKESSAGREVIDAAIAGLFERLPDEIVIRIYSFVDVPAIGRVAQVCKRFHRLSGDLPLWKQIISDKTNMYESGANNDATRSYYIKKFKQYKERQRKLEEEERKRQLQIKLREREEACSTIMTFSAFNRFYEWIATFGIIFTTIATALKLQGVVDWHWALIFIPFYFIILQFLYAPVMYDGASQYFEHDFEDDLSEDHRYIGPIFYLLLIIMPLGRNSDWKRRALVYSNTYLSILFLLFGVIKVCIPGAYGWWVMFLPLLLQCSILIGLIVHGDYDRIWEDDQWVDRVLWIMMTVTLMISFIFMLLKLDDVVSWSWYVALIPLWILKGEFVFIPVVLSLVSACCGYSCRSRTRWSDDSSVFCAIAFVVAIVVIGPLLVFEVLLAQHAEGDITTSFTLIFVPLFILEGCACLGCLTLNIIASSD